MSKTIGLIGAGNMGNAIINGLLSNKTYNPMNIAVANISVESLDKISKKFPDIRTSTSNADVSDSDILILAVKPQSYKAVIDDIKKHVPDRSIVVTIAAGITLDTVSALFGGRKNIVRAMPNTPALVSEGMTALCPGPGVDNDALKNVLNIFAMLGKTIRLPEHLMDAYASLAGSSPAIVVPPGEHI